MNIIKKRGEDFVRESFESLCNQSNDIIVMDYGSEDNIKEVSESYGFKFFNVPKTLGFYFHISKMTNKSIFEAKEKYYARVTVDVVYHPKTTVHITNLLNKKKDNECVTIQVKKSYSNFKSPMTIYNRNMLLETKGIDERIYFYGGEHKYLRQVYLNRFNLIPTYDYNYLKLWHRPHSRDYPISIESKIYKLQREWTNKKIEELRNDFEANIVNAINSYW